MPTRLRTDTAQLPEPGAAAFPSWSWITNTLRLLWVERSSTTPTSSRSAAAVGAAVGGHSGWYPLRKGVAYLPRHAAVSAAVNHRYLPRRRPDRGEPAI